jgi:hypothetical protein
VRNPHGMVTEHQERAAQSRVTVGCAAGAAATMLSHQERRPQPALKSSGVSDAIGSTRKFVKPDLSH